MPVKFADKLPTYDIPSKWDIIPVHASDRATFKYCRRQWAWSSPSRMNLIPKIDTFGIREPLWFGTGIHQALEKYYSPLREDPEVAFTTWFNLQWSGGPIHVSEMRHFEDRAPYILATSKDDIVIVPGLDELLPNADHEHFMKVLDLGQGMMRNYKDYAEANDNFTVVATEHDFSVPILDRDGNVLYMVDKRKMPENWEPDLGAENEFGPLMTEEWKDYTGGSVHTIRKQCHARGRMDMILRDNETGKYGVKDYKTAAKVGDDYFRHLDLDEQVTTYLTLGEVEAKIYGLPYEKLEFIIYEALLKAYPRKPTILRDGISPSINRNEESTTPELFAAYVNSNPVYKMIYEKDAKAQAYYDWLVETKDTRFINRQDRWRNATQRTNSRIRLYYEAVDMLSDPVLYPTPRKEYGCLNCIFRTPCLQAEDGSDYSETLAMSYQSNWDR